MIATTTISAVEQIDAYIRAVESGERVAGRLERLAVERFLGDLTEQDAREIEWRPELAESAIRFFSLLRLTDGQYAGSPFELEPWQAFIVGNLFGWTRRASGYRRFTDAYISVARGNGKTPLGAGLLIKLLGFDTPPEPYAEGYTAATKRDQARLSFDWCRRLIEKSPGLANHAAVTKDYISFPVTGSKIVPLSNDPGGADGYNIHGVLMDELHAWKPHHKPFHEKIMTGTGKRRQSLAFTITTAGSEESKIWEQEYNYAKQVLEPGNGVEADSLFAVIFEIDDEDEELDETAWQKSNPMLASGVVKIEKLRSMAARAKFNPATRSELRRYHCNKQTRSRNKLVEPETWARGAKPLPYDRMNDSETDCFAAIDWGWKDDLAAIGYCFPIGHVEIDGVPRPKYAVTADVWVPDNERRNLGLSPWRQWITSNLLRVVRASTVDTATLMAQLDRRSDQWSIRSVAYDQNNAREAGEKIEALGLETYAFSQSCRKYHEPLTEFLAALGEGRLIHGGNPLLAWCADNLISREDAAGYRMPDKKRSRDKIDPIVAIVMALSEAMFANRDTCFWEENDLEVI